MGNPTEGREDSLHDGLVEPYSEERSFGREASETDSPANYSPGYYGQLPGEDESGHLIGDDETLDPEPEVNVPAGTDLGPAFDRFKALEAQGRVVRAFEDGLDIGSGVADRAARRAIAGAVLAILGKDRSDGPVDLGALGMWIAGDGTGAAAECWKPKGS